jgi:hypothetical protein
MNFFETIDESRDTVLVLQPRNTTAMKWGMSTQDASIAKLHFHSSEPRRLTSSSPATEMFFSH